MKHTSETGSSLRTVDALIKAGKLEEALEIIKSVIASDASNFYARAYQERIADLLANRKTPSPLPTPPTATPSDPNIPKETPKGAVSEKLFNAGVEAYERFLQEIWKDGTVNDAEERKRNDMMRSLGISEDEHEYLEQKVRIQHFLHSVRSEFISGSKNMETLYRKFRVTPQEQFILEVKVHKIISSINARATILVLDDDLNLLLLLQKVISKKGYSCFTTSSAEEALELLDEIMPDLVLCDIAFGDDRMNGFMFYEKFRSMKKFISVPVIFISGINQEKMVEVARRLGADDYLIKPVEPSMLLAAIEGKLKRSMELRNG